MDIPLSEDIAAVKNDKLIWVAIAVLGVAVIGSAAWFATSRVNSRGFLKLGKHFVNIGQQVFEGDDDLFYLVCEPSARTVWTKETKENGSFLLKTEIESVVFVLMDDALSDALPDLVFIAPAWTTHSPAMFSRDWTCGRKFLNLSVENVLVFGAKKNLAVRMVSAQ